MSNTKTPGQVASLRYYPQFNEQDWFESSPAYKQEWEAVAAAVIAHHEAQKDPFAELKAREAGGERIQVKLANSGWVTTAFCAWYPNFQYRVKPWHKIKIALPALTLTHGKHSLASQEVSV